MQRLPPELVQHVLEYAFPPACQQPPVPVCQAWVLRTCCPAAPVGCPGVPPLCSVHQTRELALWDELWQTAHTQHTNYFPLRHVHVPTLQYLQTHMASHLPFEIIGIVTAPPPQEAWIWIAPGRRAVAWWEAYRQWSGLPPCD